MTRLMRGALLGCLCLCFRPAHSQTAFRLEPGTVVQRPLVGIDPAVYESTQLNSQLDQEQLALRAQQILGWRRLHQADSVAAAKQAQELAATRLDVSKLTKDLGKQQERTRKALALPVQKPLLLSGQFYTGTAVGAVLALLTLVVLR